MALAATPALLIPDFSEWNPGADMAGVAKANGGAAIIRACYGTSHPDKIFPQLRRAAASYRFLGIYLYLVATQNASAQAEAFCRITGRLAAHEVAIVDLEEGAGSQAGRARVVLGHLETRLGRRPWLYSGEAFAQEHGLVPFFDGSAYHTWVAAYGDQEPALGHTLWQCTDGKTGSHITSWPGAGKCDTSLYHGTLDGLAALIDPPAAKPARPPEEPMLLNKGAAAITPIALPQGATAVRFLASGSAQVKVDTRNGKTETLTLTAKSAKAIDVPDGVHGFIAHREDDGAADVSFVVLA